MIWNCKLLAHWNALSQLSVGTNFCEKEFNWKVSCSICEKHSFWYPPNHTRFLWGPMSFNEKIIKNMWEQKIRMSQLSRKITIEICTIYVCRKWVKIVHGSPVYLICFGRARTIHIEHISILIKVMAKPRPRLLAEATSVASPQGQSPRPWLQHASHQAKAKAGHGAGVHKRSESPRAEPMAMSAVHKSPR